MKSEKWKEGAQSHLVTQQRYQWWTIPHGNANISLGYVTPYWVFCYINSRQIVQSLLRNLATPGISPHGPPPDITRQKCRR